MTLAQKHANITKCVCYLYDGCGVGRVEDRRVVINVGDVDVKGDSGGHGGRAAVEGLH